MADEKEVQLEQEENQEEQQEEVINPLEESDEDILKNTPPDTSVSTSSSDNNEENSKEVKDETTQSSDGSDKGSEDETKDTSEEKPKIWRPSPDGKYSDESSEKDSEEKIDYKDFYKKVVETPFKANGKKDLKVRNAQEAIQLMQQGANYVQKMQTIAPYRKIIIMLQNNGLLDEAKLSYLIDLDKKNPKAIAKLVKDANIDPIDIDVDESEQYSNPNYSVSNEEANFVSVLEELKTTEDGMNTLIEIDKNWDKASKDALWNDPEIMNTINSQRQTGVYQMITEEVNRQRTLGNIPAQMPFLAAYKQVGDAMVAQQAKKKPIGRGTRQKTYNPYSSDSRVRSAAPTKSSPKRAEKYINPLSMSDEEFFKQMQQNRF